MLATTRPTATAATAPPASTTSSVPGGDAERQHPGRKQPGQERHARQAYRSQRPTRDNQGQVAQGDQHAHRQGRQHPDVHGGNHGGRPSGPPHRARLPGPGPARSRPVREAAAARKLSGTVAAGTTAATACGRGDSGPAGRVGRPRRVRLSRRRRRRHRLGVAPAARAGARRAHAAGPAVGAEQVPRLPGSARRVRYRPDLRALH